MFQVTKFYLPGTTDPEPWPEMRDHLLSRRVDTVDGGADLMFGLIRMAECQLIGPKSPSDPGDLRNRVIASCVKHNCMSVINWLVERGGEKPWVAYVGIWNETLGVAVLEAAHYCSTPYVWIATDVEAFRAHFRLHHY